MRRMRPRMLPGLAIALCFSCPAAVLAQPRDAVSNPRTAERLREDDGLSVRVGIQVAWILEEWAAAEIGSYRTVELLFGTEVSPFVDVPLAREVHLRTLLVLGPQSAEHARGPSDADIDYRFGTGFFHAGVRGLIGWVPIPELAIRIGGDVGIDVLFPRYDVGVYGGPTLEIAGRFLERERLEIALQLGLQSRPYSYYTTPPYGPEAREIGGVWSPWQGIAITYLF